MTELELMANEEARHGNREALERLEAELREARMTELAALGQAQEARMSDLNPYEESLAVDLALAESRIEELEAKLAKAVEGFEELARLGNGDRYGNSLGNMIAKEYLAELTGGKDE